MEKMQALGFLSEYLSQRGIVLSAQELADFELTGGESLDDLDEIANDYWNDIQTERAGGQ